ncbi:MAG: ATP-binding protein [Chloroflexota bacterium]
MILDDLGLIPTLKQHIQDFDSKNTFVTDLEILGPEQRFPPHIEVTLFRIIQGLLKNISSHANAQKATVTLDVQSDRVSTTIHDNGSGFDVQSTLAKARDQKKMGIMSIQEQVSMLGGEIAFESEIGEGTTVTISLPLE